MSRKSRSDFWKGVGIFTGAAVTVLANSKRRPDVVVIEEERRPRRRDHDDGRVSFGEAGQMIDSLGDAVWDRTRLAMIEEFCDDRRFKVSCGQAAAMLSKFDFDSRRREAAMMLKSRVTDPRNMFKLRDTFDFRSF